MKWLRKLIKSNRLLKSLIYRFYRVRLRTITGKRNQVVNEGVLINIKYDIIGNDNKIIVGKDAYVTDTTFYLRGDRHEIWIGADCKYYGGSIWLEDSDCRVYIGEKTTVMDAHLCAQENKSIIRLGKDCMLSNNIIIRTSDSHSIIDNDTKHRINPAQNINIGDHVWIGAWARILKGTTIGNNSVIAIGSIVTSKVESNCIAAGIPAKVVKENIDWDREKL